MTDDSVSRLLLEYDGGPFCGWARQPGERSVEGEVARALATILRHDVDLTVAGRTDRGVHAWGQVASYVGAPVPMRSINALLPQEIVVLACDSAPDGFDARHDALTRTYCYRVLARRAPGAFERGRALWWPHAIDRQALHACAAALPGRHDLTAFTPSQTGHTRFDRRIHAARWEDRGEILEFWIEAESFMRHMNRILVGTMLEVAGGRRALEAFTSLLAGRPRAEAGDTAPAHGLYLAGVSYESTAPTMDEPA